ncbi:MAG: MFS transporter, partial [Chthonomonadales bacterium]
MNDYIEQLGDAAAPEEAPLSAEKSFWYSIANLGYGMFFSFNNAVIALFLAHFTKDYRFIGWMSSSHSMEGIVIQPVIGAWSDRLRTKLGRRRPFMLAAIPLCSIFMILTPLAANLPGSVRLGAIIVLIFAFTV